MTPTLIKPTVGARVYFNTSSRARSGIVTAIVPDITNGRKHVWVRVDHGLPGIHYCVPVDELLTHYRDIVRALVTAPLLGRVGMQAISENVTGDGANFVFLSGDKNPLNFDQNDRRFFVLDAPKKPKFIDPLTGKTDNLQSLPPGTDVPAYLKTLIERIEK